MSLQNSEYIEWEDPFKELKEQERQEKERFLFEDAYSTPSCGWFYAKDSNGKYKDIRVEECWQYWLEKSKTCSKHLEKVWHLWEYRRAYS